VISSVVETMWVTKCDKSKACDIVDQQNAKLRSSPYCLDRRLDGF
jgi:hypothetical protein